MKSLASLVAVWLLTGLGAVAGSIPGNAAGKAGLFAGAVVGGSALAYLSPLVCSRLGWMARGARRAASIGADRHDARAEPSSDSFRRIEASC